MPDRIGRTPRWHDAADRAEFTFYEPVAPGRRHRWAGGFGCGRDTETPTALEVLADVDGVKVSVDTRLQDRRLPHQPRDVGLGPMALDLLTSLLLDGTDLQLPMSINLVADDRTIVVDGQETPFAGVRIEGSPRWLGETDLADVIVRVTLFGDLPALSLVPCRDWHSLPELPPPGR